MFLVEIFIGLILVSIFGGFASGISERQNERKQREMKEQAKREVDEIMKRIDRDAKAYTERWKKTGLPPSQWK